MIVFLSPLLFTTDPLNQGLILRLLTVHHRFVRLNEASLGSKMQKANHFSCPIVIPLGSVPSSLIGQRKKMRVSDLRVMNLLNVLIQVRSLTLVLWFDFFFDRTRSFASAAQSRLNPETRQNPYLENDPRN